VPGRRFRRVSFSYLPTVIRTRARVRDAARKRGMAIRHFPPAGLGERLEVGFTGPRSTEWRSPRRGLLRRFCRSLASQRCDVTAKLFTVRTVFDGQFIVDTFWAKR